MPTQTFTVSVQDEEMGESFIASHQRREAVSVEVKERSTFETSFYPEAWFHVRQTCMKATFGPALLLASGATRAMECIFNITLVYFLLTAFFAFGGARVAFFLIDLKNHDLGSDYNMDFVLRPLNIVAFVVMGLIDIYVVVAWRYYEKRINACFANPLTPLAFVAVPKRTISGSIAMVEVEKRTSETTVLAAALKNEQETSELHGLLLEKATASKIRLYLMTDGWVYYRYHEGIAKIYIALAVWPWLSFAYGNIISGWIAMIGEFIVDSAYGLIFLVLFLRSLLRC